MELALPWLKLAGILVMGIAGSVVTIRFAVAAIRWAKKNRPEAASFMLGGYLDRAFGPAGQSTGESTEQPVVDGLWTQFTDWLGEQIDAMNESPGSSNSGADSGGSTNGWSETGHHTSCGDGGSGSGDRASSC